MILGRNKAELRRVFYEKRAKLNPETRLRAAEQAARNALAVVEELKGPVALYWPVRNEISPLILAEHLHHEGFGLCLPVVIEQGLPLQFRCWSPGDVLHKGRYGIDGPSQKSPFIVPVILFVPLLAFDRTGTRLGTGGGYYDRTLQGLRAANPNVKAYGYAYAVQEVGTIPQEPHDEKLDAVVTEKEVVSFR